VRAFRCLLTELQLEPRRSVYAISAGKIFDDALFDRLGRCGGARLPFLPVRDEALSSNSEPPSETAIVMYPGLGGAGGGFDAARKGGPAVPNTRWAFEFE